MRNLSYENEFYMQFHFHANQSHFHKNGFALRLALKQRHKGTRKWLIQVTITTTYRSYKIDMSVFINRRLETTDKEKDKKCFGSKATTLNYRMSKVKYLTECWYYYYDIYSVLLQ